MEHPVERAIRALLAREGIQYDELVHAPAVSSAQCARARGPGAEDVRIGGKALVLKLGEAFRLCVLSGGLQVEWAALKRYFQVQQVRLASRAELAELTGGLMPGVVPPFGKPLLPLELCVDPSTLANTRIAFNCASLTRSVVMSVADYVRVAQPFTVLHFAVSK